MTKVMHDSATPTPGQQVITACAFIHHNFDGVIKVFLAKRADTKKFLPGLYELPGGHVDFDEDIVDGLRREVKEELNMTLNVGDPFTAFTYGNTIKGSHSVEVVYFGTFVESFDKITIDPGDHSRYDWFTKEEVVQHKAQIESFDPAIHKDGDDDPEYLAILKGFDLIAGATLNYA